MLNICFDLTFGDDIAGYGGGAGLSAGVEEGGVLFAEEEPDFAACGCACDIARAAESCGVLRGWAVILVDFVDWVGCCAFGFE